MKPFTPKPSRKTKTFELYTVRNHLGQYMGCYRATSAEAALRAELDARAIYNSQFRRHQLRDMDKLTAKVEETR